MQSTGRGMLAVTEREVWRGGNCVLHVVCVTENGTHSKDQPWLTLNLKVPP